MWQGIITETKKEYGIQCIKTVVEWFRKFGNFDWAKSTKQIDVVCWSI